MVPNEFDAIDYWHRFRDMPTFPFIDCSNEKQENLRAFALSHTPFQRAFSLEKDSFKIPLKKISIKRIPTRVAVENTSIHAGLQHEDMRVSIYCDDEREFMGFLSRRKG